MGRIEIASFNVELKWGTVLNVGRHCLQLDKTCFKGTFGRLEGIIEELHQCGLPRVVV